MSASYLTNQLSNQQIGLVGDRVDGVVCSLKNVFPSHLSGSRPECTDREGMVEDTDRKGFADGVRSPRRMRGLTSRALCHES